MWGARVVWTEPVNNVLQILTYDTVSAKPKQVLAPSNGAQFRPRIQGDKVVWIDHRNTPGDMWNWNNSDIYLYDLKTKTTTAVTTHPARQDFPDVWGDWVVWQDWRNNPNPVPTSGPYINADIYAKNLKTGKEVQVTSFPKQETRPQIDNGRVFFSMEDRTGYLSIFMIDLNKLLDSGTP